MASFRYSGLRKWVLGVLATLWIVLALHPCAMAFAKYEAPAVSPQHHCPHCPPAHSVDGQCELSDWQQSHATPSTPSADGAFLPIATLESFVALSSWSPVNLGLSPPLVRHSSLHRPPPLARQDRLRL